MHTRRAVQTPSYQLFTQQPNIFSLFLFTTGPVTRPIRWCKDSAKIPLLTDSSPTRASQTDGRKSDLNSRSFTT